jgi:hypothetical protein
MQNAKIICPSADSCRTKLTRLVEAPCGCETAHFKTPGLLHFMLLWGWPNTLLFPSLLGSTKKSNPLKSKLLWIIQSVPQRERHISPLQTSTGSWCLRNQTAVYSENHTRPINTFVFKRFRAEHVRIQVIKRKAMSQSTCNMTRKYCVTSNRNFPLINMRSDKRWHEVSDPAVRNQKMCERKQQLTLPGTC